MSNRIFFKLLLMFLVVIAAVTATLGITAQLKLTQKTLPWASGLAVLVAVALSLIAAIGLASFAADRGFRRSHRGRRSCRPHRGKLGFVNSNRLSASSLTMSHGGCDSGRLFAAG